MPVFSDTTHLLETLDINLFNNDIPDRLSFFFTYFPQILFLVPEEFKIAFESDEGKTDCKLFFFRNFIIAGKEYALLFVTDFFITVSNVLK